MKKIIFIALILIIFALVAIGQKVQKVQIIDSNGRNVANRMVTIFRQADPCHCENIAGQLKCDTSQVAKGTTDKSGQIKFSGLAKDTFYIAALDFTCAGRCDIATPVCNPSWVKAVRFQLSNDFVTITDTLPFRKKGKGRRAEDVQLGSVEIFPNPALNQIDFKATGKEGLFQLLIYNITGQQIVRKEIILQSKGNYTMDISSFIPGMYSVILTNNTVRFSGSFLKE